jgi:hypothetical protein
MLSVMSFEDRSALGSQGIFDIFLFLNHVDSITDLGVVMDSRMSFYRHIDVTVDDRNGVVVSNGDC